MKKVKSVEAILKESGLIESMIESVSRFMKVDRNTASKIVQLRLDSALNEIGKNMHDAKIQSRKKNYDSPISDISNEDIVNSENLIKDK